MISKINNENGKSDNKDENYKDDDKETEKRNIPIPILRPKYTMYVDGIGSVHDVLIDSGSTCCLVRKDLLTDSIIKKKKRTKTTATLIDESIMNFEGSVDLCVTYLGQKVKMPFLVTSKESNSRMLLGAN